MIPTHPIFLGAGSGFSQGVIQAVNLTHTSQGCTYNGVFAVIGSQRQFAHAGDIGAAVVDPYSCEVLGLVCDVTSRLCLRSGWCDDVTLCVRLDLCLLYAEHQWGIRLCVDQQAEPRLPHLTLLVSLTYMVQSYASRLTNDR